MKRAYLTNGTLSFSAAPKDTILTIDSVTYNYLRDLLGVDYCYLVIDSTEIVKVLGCVGNNSIAVERGLEDTRRGILQSGSKIEYKITSSEILDAVNFVGYSLVASGQIKIDTADITYNSYTIIAFGGIEITGDGKVWRIEDIPDNAGCGLNIPPEIPINFQPYRVLATGEGRITDDGTYREYV